MSEQKLFNHVTSNGDSTAARRLTSGNSSVHPTRSSSESRILSVVATYERGTEQGTNVPERRVCLKAMDPSRGDTISVEIQIRGAFPDGASQNALQAAFFEALSLTKESEPPAAQTRRKAVSARPESEVVPTAMPAGTQTAPKRRGRPPKARPAEEIVVSKTTHKVGLQTHPEPAPGKRPVGRPRIHPKPDPNAPKRPVGRPRKNPQN